jgi:hypothetical protein
MARFELLEMTNDKWSDDVWNGPMSTISSQNHPFDRPKLYFYWGDNDHWIDNSTRDSVIASRARKGSGKEDEWKPTMEIDTHGTPHDFCISERGSLLLRAKSLTTALDVESSKLVAQKTAGYIKEIVTGLGRRVCDLSSSA